MCGICGFTGKTDPELLSRMTIVLAHRGPDQSGYYEDDQVSFGQRRLSIIDLSKAGQQPYFNEDKSIVVIYNGEIYNFKDLRSRLEKQGHLFRSATDGEVIVHLYEEYGLKFVDSLLGMFAIAIWDKRRNDLHLVRDRLGIKPLYYMMDAERFVFASEIKSVMQHSGIDISINEKAFFEYLTYQYSTGQSTCIEGIKRVEPATIMTWHDGKLTTRNYWQPQFKSYSGADSPAKIAGMLRQAVNDRMVADVPVGVMLSGGLDSSSVVAMIDRQINPQLSTFTVGFGKDNDEFKYARMVANMYNTDHHEINIAADLVMDDLPNIVWSMDEPMADGGGIATYLAMRELKKHVKVLLVGEGSDEIFAGYTWHRLGVSPFTYLPDSIKKRLYYYLTTFSRLKDENATEVYKSFCDQFSANRERFEGRTFSDGVTAFEIKNLLANSLLMKVDKMTMAHSIEARVPFLDHRLVEFALSLPIQDKTTWRQGKTPLRKAMEGLLPADVLVRKKQGFSLPISAWLRGAWKEPVIDMLGSSYSYSSRLIGRDEIVALLKPRRGLGDIAVSSFLWRLLIFETWYQRMMSNRAEKEASVSQLAIV